jgi:hypothetical protein
MRLKKEVTFCDIDGEFVRCDGICSDCETFRDSLKETNSK